jgi:hypothetical protein
MKEITAYLYLFLLLCNCTASKQYKKYENPKGLFPIGLNGKWGFVDSIGNIKISTTFDETNFFEYGLAVAKQNNKFGFIDEQGKWVIKPKFDKAGDFLLWLC